jgi:hypothetical protein
MIFCEEATTVYVIAQKHKLRRLQGDNVRIDMLPDFLVEAAAMAVSQDNAQEGLTL